MIIWLAFLGLPWPEGGVALGNFLEKRGKMKKLV